MIPSVILLLRVKNSTTTRMRVAGASTDWETAISESIVPLQKKKAGSDLFLPDKPEHPFCS